VARTYTSQIPSEQTCETPYCGGRHKYFCVKCRHYVVSCRCEPGQCECGTDAYWAANGERPLIRRFLKRDQEEKK
jgi:hypothetical protein